MINIIIIFIALAYINAAHLEKVNSQELENYSPFAKYSFEKLEKVSDNYCQNPNFFIEKADIEESKPENQDKIILYHGEYYSTWIFQLIMKAFMFPEAKEDWLPLRFLPLEKEIDKYDLLKLMQPYKTDERSAYTNIGISVTANLISEHTAESAWSIICGSETSNWHEIGGLAFSFNTHEKLYTYLKENFIAESKWEHFIIQRDLIDTFIQIRRRQQPFYSVEEFQQNVEKYFPKVSNDYHYELRKVFHELRHYDPANDKFYNEGVVLQIIMDKEIANDLTYFSFSYGHPRSEKSNIRRIFYNGEELEPYSENYEKVKNKYDFEQARVTMNRDFRTFPSRIRIKSIAGIMEDPKDYEILKSMIKEMVNSNKRW